jgi:GT2 family glycosyltransferase
MVVTVVDSAPRSDEAKILADRYGSEYQSSSARGLSRARNIGARAAQSDIVAFLDDDMVPHVRWLESLLKEFADDDVVAVTGPILPIELSGSPWTDITLALTKVPWGPHGFRINKSDPDWFVRANFGGVGDGNFAIRRNAFHRISGFEERLGRGTVINTSEEHYAYFMLLSIGNTIAYAPDGIVFHSSHQNTAEYRRKLIGETVAYSIFLMWRHPSKALQIACYFVGGLMGRRRPWRLWSSQRVNPRNFYVLSLGLLQGLRSILKSLFESHRKN